MNKTVNASWIKKRLAKGQCTKCKEKAVNKWYCEKHRNSLNMRRRVAYLEEKFKNKYNI